MHPAERGLSYLLFIYSLIQTHGPATSWFSCLCEQYVSLAKVHFQTSQLPKLMSSFFFLFFLSFFLFLSCLRSFFSFFLSFFISFFLSELQELSVLSLILVKRKCFHLDKNLQILVVWLFFLVRLVVQVNHRLCFPFLITTRNV